MEAGLASPPSVRAPSCPWHLFANDSSVTRAKVLQGQGGRDQPASGAEKGLFQTGTYPEILSQAGPRDGRHTDSVIA